MTKGCATDLTNGRGFTRGETCQMKSINRIQRRRSVPFPGAERHPVSAPAVFASKRTSKHIISFLLFFPLLSYIPATRPDVIFESKPTRNSPGFDILLKDNNNNNTQPALHSRRTTIRDNITRVAYIACLTCRNMINLLLRNTRRYRLNRR